MAEPLKSLYNADLVQGMAAHLARRSTGFDPVLFQRLAIDGLDDLEMMQRSDQISRALDQAYSLPFADTVHDMISALHPDTSAESAALSMDDAGIAGFAVWPMSAFVARNGLQTPEFSLEALREMTMRFSSEFAVRPFFRDHVETTLSAAKGWANDPNVHVRRLASEGSRPRLPWGIRLHEFVKDPVPILPILATLRDDPSDYVRRSVANNLNDIAKDHPNLVAGIAVDWRESGGRARARLVRHACRTLIKSGHAGALAAFGFTPPKLADCRIRLSKTTIRLGEPLGITLDLIGSQAAQKLLIDYVMHFPRANGNTSAKVFKWTEISMQKGEARTLTKTHAYRQVTTRRDYPGPQRLSVRINGQDFEGPTFDLMV